MIDIVISKHKISLGACPASAYTILMVDTLIVSHIEFVRREQQV